MTVSEDLLDKLKDASPAVKLAVAEAIDWSLYIGAQHGFNPIGEGEKSQLRMLNCVHVLRNQAKEANP